MSNKFSSEEMQAFASVKPLFEIIHKSGGKVRIVGGAVRDTILGLPVHDIDLATTLRPEDVMHCLGEDGIKTVPTGIDYGTVTAILDGNPYEITTLRKDISSDGRRAEVSFTDIWEEDAARRDFTFNALYLDEDGTVYDYFDGIADLKKGMLRFIGDPILRIAEDYLRILRAYRFKAQLGVNIEAESGAACAKLADKIPILSAERIWLELSKLLSTTRAGHVWHEMGAAGISKFVLPMAEDYSSLLVNLCKQGIHTPITALSAIVAQEDDAAVAKHLKLSKKEWKEFTSIHAIIDALHHDLSEIALSKQLYRHDRAYVLSALDCLKAEGHDVSLDSYAAAKLWKQPTFPLQGSDLMALGIKEGPEIGSILKEVEGWWINGGFKADHEACLDKAKTLKS